MADFTPIPDTALDPDAPLTSELAYAWRDNPIAIAEGAVGAPKVMGKALDTLLAGDQSSNFIITDLDRVSTILISGILPGSIASPINLTINRSSNGGATWGGDIIVFTSTSDQTTVVTPLTRAISVVGFNAVRFIIGSGGGNAAINRIYCFAVNGVAP